MDNVVLVVYLIIVVPIIAVLGADNLVARRRMKRQGERVRAFQEQERRRTALKDLDRVLTEGRAFLASRRSGK